jgi:hypothetical protein
MPFLTAKRVGNAARRETEFANQGSMRTKDPFEKSDLAPEKRPPRLIV